MEGCSPMSNLSINVLEPGAITVDKSIHSIALIDRAAPDNKVVNVIEGVLTGEGLSEDKQDRKELLAGLNQNLIQSPRFTAKLTSVEWKGSGSGNVFPAALSWKEVEKVCHEYSVDALLSLETFDSDCITQTASKNVEKTDKDGKKTTVQEFYADQTVYIKYGLRLYNYKNKTIEDQYATTQTMQWHTKGTTVQDALNSMINKRMACRQTCEQAGYAYGHRISPTWVSVRRAYYRKGNEAMAKAGRKAAVGDWDAANEIWKNNLHNAKLKIAGRAAYNLAVVNEVRGDLQAAKTWAMRSYSDFNNKKARYYSNILDNRIWEQQKLDQQMSKDIQ